MMKMRNWFAIGLAVAGIAGLSLYSVPFQSGMARAEAPEGVAGKPEPVEGDPHEFMEYVFQPAYKRLKAAMASKSANDRDLNAVKSNALMLAEGGNLLLIRRPEEKSGTWTRHAVMVRNLGGKLYRAAGEKDGRAVRKQYTALLKKCNSCHQEFAHGEHQLKP